MLLSLLKRTLLVTKRIVEPNADEVLVKVIATGVKERNTPLHTEDGEDISQFFGQSSFSNYVTANEKNIVKVDDERNKM